MPQPTVLSVFAVEPKRVGGTEAFARELSSQLSEAGWASVLVFVKQPPQHVLQFLTLDNVTIEVLEDVWTVTPRTLWRVARLLQKYQPAVTHLHYIKLLTPYPWLARLVAGSSVFFTDQTSQPEGFVPTPRPAWKRWVARVITYPIQGLISVSRYGQNTILVSGLTSSAASRVIYNSVDLSRGNPGAELGNAFRHRHAIPLDRLVVLQVSWLIPEKGLTDLLRAARIVLDTRRDVQFVFAGEGPSRAAFEALATELGISEHVTWTGLVGDPFSEGLYAAADIVCQVSRWQEVFGWVIAEAMLTEKPVLGTQVGGIPELIVDGETGILVEARNVVNIADGLCRLLNDPGLRTRLGRAGAGRCRTHFDLRQNVKEHLRLYGVPV
ncbi:MAG: glycosyltransferase family 4 protein [Vicinamibacterales bacterium]